MGTTGKENLKVNATVDVIILGVGSCGEDLSLQLLDAGLNVVGIEASLVGGECPYYACLPSKVMVRAANVLKEAERLNGMAGHAEVIPDWKQVSDRVRETTGNWDDSVAADLHELLEVEKLAFGDEEGPEAEFN
ncbi:MAG: FAD-dependent oxidoreductase [Bacillota bacterium]|nr:FAD-dependent oxidoreductase [Bacillota bacterium]MDW7729518.1 FAD-dependent oxidoreductase [Bacillota bacterium]